MIVTKRKTGNGINNFARNGDFGRNTSNLVIPSTDHDRITVDVNVINIHNGRMPTCLKLPNGWIIQVFKCYYAIVVTLGLLLDQELNVAKARVRFEPETIHIRDAYYI